MVAVKGGGRWFLPSTCWSIVSRESRGREKGRTDEIIVLRLMADDDPSFYAADFNTGEGTNYLVILLAENFAPPAVLRRVAGPRVHVAAVSHKRTLCGRAALRFRKATREWLSRSLKMEKILVRRYMNVRGKLPRFVNCVGPRFVRFPTSMQHSWEMM